MMRPSLIQPSVILFALLASFGAHAEEMTAPILSGSANFSESSGAALFANVCQGCHMRAAQGAAGAGRYPALADNPSLEAGAYPVYVVVNGLKGMPPVGKMMSDDQVAAVVNYLRTHFGNNFRDPVTAQDVTAARN